jgi:Leucine-rich repeat (LRR) protein
MAQNSSLHRPLSVKKVVKNEDSVEVWINNPSPYFTYIPEIASDGKPNIVFVGYPGYQLSKIDFAVTGSYETIVDLEKLYSDAKLIKNVYKLTTITNMPESLDLIEGSAEEIDKLLDFGSTVEVSAPASDLALALVLADTDLASIALKVLKEINKQDSTAWYIFENWFLLRNDPINVIDNDYEKTANAQVYYNHKEYPTFGNPDVSESIRSTNDLDGNKGNPDDQYWPRGWSLYQHTYGLPKNGKDVSFVLFPDTALVLRLTRTQGDGTTTRTTRSPPSSTAIVSNPELGLIIREYQSLETIEAESPRPSAEDLEKELNIYLPYLINHRAFANSHSARVDEGNIRDTLSCIFNGNYKGSKYLPEGDTKEYDGTTFDYYNFRAKFVKDGTPVYTNLKMETSLLLEEDKTKVPPTSTEESTKKEVVFPDLNLDAAIRAAINKPEGTIYIADLEGLKSLDASEKSIKDITGLEYCTDLKDLDLSMNLINDVSPLSGLKSLERLYLGYITPFHLTRLPVTSPVIDGPIHVGNMITDVSPLSSLMN